MAAMQLQCSECPRTFASTRGLAVHACTKHGLCSDRTQDRHADPLLTIRVPKRLLSRCKTAAKRQKLTMAEFTRRALEQATGR